MHSFELRLGEVAGFDLGGWRQPSGVIKIDGINGHRFIDDWPKEIPFLGATYTLEEVTPGAVKEDTGERWENAIYV